MKNRIYILIMVILTASAATIYFACGGGGGSDTSGGGGTGDTMTAEVTVDPDGGEYFLSNGVVLQVPAGAVDQSVTLTFRIVEESEVQNIFDSYGITEITEKEFMCAVQIKPYGIKFNAPIDITLPSKPLVDSTYVPYLFIVNKTRDIYTPLMDGSSSSSLVSTAELSDLYKNVIITDCENKTVTYRIDEIIQELIEGDYSTDEVMYVTEQVGNRLAASDCIKDPCRCCGIRVQESSADLIEDGKCYNASVKGSIQYLDCEGEPIEDWDFEERSIGSIAFVPNSERIKVGQSASISAVVKDAVGNPIPGYSIQSVVSSDPLMVEVVSKGADFFIVKGASVGKVTITVDAGCDIKNQMTVIVEETSFVVDTDPVTVPEGGTQVFSIKLSDPPPLLSTVTATVAHFSGDTDISVQSGATLTFDSSNWDFDQPVTLAAAEDSDAEDGTATIRIDADVLYVWNTLVTANESDNDVLKFVTNTGSVTVPENETATFQVKLNLDPVTTVSATVARVSGDTDIAVDSGASLTFDSTNWDIFQTVTLSAADDPDIENGSATIGIRSTDVQNKDIDATERDDDGFVTSTDVVSVPEGGTASFQVKLLAEPVVAIPVTVTRVSGDSDITVQSGSTLVFDSANWDSFQTVTLAAAEDSDDVNGIATIGIRSPRMNDKNIVAKESDIANMSGSWEEVVTEGGQTCLIIAGGSETIEEEWYDVKLPIEVTQTGTALAAYNTDFPTSEPHTGSLTQTSDPNYPYAFTMSVSSANTIDCIRFFQSNGNDIVFGQPACDGDTIRCEPLSCFETEIVEGKISADGQSFTGTSLHTFEATANAREKENGTWVYYPNAKVYCEGGSYITGTRK
jgi:hypothetical protein